jgi:hypothetical protein
MCFFVCDKFEGLVLCLMSDLELEKTLDREGFM